MKDYRGYYAGAKPLIAAMLLAGQSHQQVSDFLSHVFSWPLGNPTPGMIRHLNSRWSGTYRTLAERKRGMAKQLPRCAPIDWVDVISGAP